MYGSDRSSKKNELISNTKCQIKDHFIFAKESDEK
jgi:hypothetical protein